MVSVLVIADAPRPGECNRGLEPLLGPESCARLQEALIRRAVAWAQAIAPDATFVACHPLDAVGDFATLVPAGVTITGYAGADAGERATGAAQAVFARAGRPVLVIGTSMPWLAPYHARAAAEDLAEGCDVSFGVATGGGLYLLAMARPQPRLLQLAGETHNGEMTRRVSRQIAEELGLSVGMLHYERALDRPHDAYAMAADPMLPRQISEILRFARPA